MAIAQDQDKSVLSGSVSFNNSTNTAVDFGRQVRHLSLKVVTNDCYVGFDQPANTADALFETGDNWVELTKTLCTKLYFLGSGGSGTAYYIARRTT